MTIIQAILNVMREAGRPLTPKEAYERILEKDLYSFRAQNPQGVVTPRDWDDVGRAAAQARQ